MLIVKFICACLEDGFPVSDMQLLANQMSDAWPMVLSPEQLALGAYPLHVDGEHSHCFGYIPGYIVDRQPEVLTDLEVELQSCMDDFNYSPSIDPELGLQIQMYNRS